MVTGVRLWLDPPPADDDSHAASIPVPAERPSAAVPDLRRNCRRSIGSLQLTDPSIRLSPKSGLPNPWRVLMSLLCRHFRSEAELTGLPARRAREPPREKLCRNDGDSTSQQRLDAADGEFANPVGRTEHVGHDEHCGPMASHLC